MPVFLTFYFLHISGVLNQSNQFSCYIITYNFLINRNLFNTDIDSQHFIGNVTSIPGLQSSSPNINCISVAQLGSWTYFI